MILIISHGNHRTGAPISLLNLSRILHENGHELIFISKTDGELTTEFEKLGPVFIWNIPWKYEPNPVKRLYNRIFNNSYRKNQIVKKVKGSNINLVINNTITNGDILHDLSFLKLKTITWVHEMETVIKIYDIQPKDLVSNTLKYSNYYFSASKAVKTNLINNHNIKENDTYVLYEIINDLVFHDNLEINSEIKNIKQPGEFIIGGCGQNGWRKGTDLFLQVAHYIKKNHPEMNLKFLWVGGNPLYGPYFEFTEEIKLLNLEDRVTVIAHNDNVNQYYNLMDLFLLTSREDPFPLAMIEAGNIGLPIIGFRKSGGVEELINEECIVNYADVKEMAEKVMLLFHNSDLMNSIGKENKSNCTKFQASNKTDEVISLIGDFIDKKIRDDKTSK